MSIHTQFGLPWEQVWVEDDCTINDPDHVTPEAAWERLVGSPFNKEDATRFEDLGDIIFYEIGEYLMALSYPGGSSISKMV